MQSREHAARTTLVLRSREVVTQNEEEALVRVVPVWAAPPNLRVLAMLGESGAQAPAALRVIRHRLEALRADGLWTFAVTSARDGEGKTTLAAQLALCLSEAQRARVLLVEANMTRPSVARVLGFRVPTGLGFSAQLAERMRGGIEPWAVLALGPSFHILAENHAEPGYPGDASLASLQDRRRAAGTGLRLGRRRRSQQSSDPGTRTSSRRRWTASSSRLAAAPRRAATSVQPSSNSATRKAVGVVLWGS